MAEHVNIWDTWMLCGLFSILIFMIGIIAMISLGQRKWQKEQKLRRETWDNEEKLRLREKTEQEEAERRRLRDEFLQAGWMLRVADMICGSGQPADRIEIWGNQLLLETGKEYEVCPLECFGLEERLTRKEMYAANLALHEVLRTRPDCRYQLVDQNLYCELIRIR